MATLVTQAIKPSGIAPTFQLCAVGDKVVPGAHTWIEIKNTSGTSVTVTVADPLTQSQAPVGATAFNPSLSIVVPITTGDMMVGPLPKERFAALSDGLIALTYSTTLAGLTIAAFSS